MTYEELLAVNREQSKLISNFQNSQELLLEINASQAEQINEQAEQISLLKQQIAALKRLIFGSKSERHISDTPPEQLNLFAADTAPEEAQVEKEEITYERKKGKKHPGRDRLPDHLPVEEIIVEPKVDLTGLKKIGEHVVETLKYIPGSLTRVRHVYPKYESLNQNNGPTIIQAAARTRSIPKCLAENSLLAHVIIAKFIDHLPFYRQIQRFERDNNWKLSKSTVNDWFIAVCTLLEPLYQTMIRKLLESKYIQADESHIRVQDGNKKGATRMGWMWVYHSPILNIVIFQYRKGRGNNGPKEFLENYIGYLQCDGYKVYDKLGQLPTIDLVGCHVHARRYFVKAKETGDKRADEVLMMYQKIYKHERACSELSADERHMYRLEYTKPLFDELKTWLDEKSFTALPKSPLGKAIKYTLGQWPKLITVLEDGKLLLDNNLIENKIRPLALGRKNYLFAGSHAAAQRIAMMYTFFATCKANDVNPYQWLKHTIDAIPEYKVNQLEALIPNKGMFDSVDEQ